MNKAESKYYNTALLMNQALIELLNKKEYDFITIKEICEKRELIVQHFICIMNLLTICWKSALKI